MSITCANDGAKKNSNMHEHYPTARSQRTAETVDKRRRCGLGHGLGTLRHFPRKSNVATISFQMPAQLPARIPTQKPFPTRCPPKCPPKYLPRFPPKFLPKFLPKCPPRFPLKFPPSFPSYIGGSPLLSLTRSLETPL